MSYQLNSVIAADVRTRRQLAPQRCYAVAASQKGTTSNVAPFASEISTLRSMPILPLVAMLWAISSRALTILSASGPEIRQAGAIRIADQFTTIPYIEEVY